MFNIAPILCRGGLFLKIKLLILTILFVAIILSGCGQTVASNSSHPKNTEALSGIDGVIKPVLLRLEDVTPGGPYQSEENLQKLHTIAHYLHEEGVPFHVSLVPRAYFPEKGYDVSIADQTPYAKAFVSTIKRMQDMGGIIGVHGYTHQSGNADTGDGFEFYDSVKNPVVPDTYEYARDRIDKAIDLFEKAGITPAYWETPHYTASLKQHLAFEEQIGLIYENYHRGETSYNYKITDLPGEGYRGFITVPTPLGYVGPANDVDKIIKNTAKLKDKDLASFFYHPFREFDYLYKDYNAKGEIYYVYDQNSPLHRLVRSFKENGYTFSSIYSLARFVPAQGMEEFPFNEGDTVCVGRFGSNGKKGVLVRNKETNHWRMYEYTAAWYIPRRSKLFIDHGVWIKDWNLEKDAVPLVGDFNGDKGDDLLLFSPRQGTFYMADNKGDHMIVLTKPSLTVSVVDPLYPLVGDFNGDSVSDVVLYDSKNERIGLVLGTRVGFKRFRWQNIDINNGRKNNLLVGDFNGDLKDDIAVEDADQGDWRLLLAGRSADFTLTGEPWLKSWKSGNNGRSFASDINGDGKSDLVAYNQSGYWQIATSDGNRFVRRGEFGPWGAGSESVPLVADMNGDKRSDLMIISGYKGKYDFGTAISVFDRPPYVGGYNNVTLNDKLITLSVKIKDQTKK